MKLEDTVGLMCSDDERDRMKAEYIQLCVRLGDLVKKLGEAGVSASTIDGWVQVGYMTSYRDVLRGRMTDIGINVDLIDELPGIWKPSDSKIGTILP